MMVILTVGLTLVAYAAAGGGVTIDNSTLAILLGTGGLASVGAFGRWIVTVRNNAEARESKAIKNLERWTRESDLRALQCLTALDAERAQSSYWRERCGAREYTIVLHGLELATYAPPPPPPPRPPEVPESATRGDE